VAASKLLHDVEGLSEYWYLVLLRGVIALVFAAAIWVATGVLKLNYGSSIAIVFIQACFGSYLLVAGLFSIGMAVLVMKQRHWRMTIVHTALLLGLAGWLFFTQGDAIEMLAVLVAIHAGLSGMGEISLARHMRRHQFQSAALFGAGLFSLAAAIALVVLIRQMERLLIVAAVYAAVFGVMVIATAFQLRTIRKEAMQAAEA
jgi:uncharacterized membrane protein HdeD (DUF308 family)